MYMKMPLYVQVITHSHICAHVNNHQLPYMCTRTRASFNKILMQNLMSKKINFASSK